MARKSNYASWQYFGWLLPVIIMGFPKVKIFIKTTVILLHYHKVKKIPETLDFAVEHRKFRVDIFAIVDRHNCGNAIIICSIQDT